MVVIHDGEKILGLEEKVYAPERVIVIDYIMRSEGFVTKVYRGKDIVIKIKWN